MVFQAVPEEGRRCGTEREPNHSAARWRRRRRRGSTLGISRRPERPRLASPSSATCYTSPTATPSCASPIRRVRRGLRRLRSRSSICREAPSTIIGPRTSSRLLTEPRCTSRSAPTATSPRTESTRKKDAPPSGNRSAGWHASNLCLRTAESGGHGVGARDGHAVDGSQRA